MKLGWLAILTTMAFVFSFILIISCSDSGSGGDVADGSATENLGSVVVNGASPDGDTQATTDGGKQITWLSDSEYSDAGTPDTSMAWDDYDFPDWYEFNGIPGPEYNDLVIGCRLEWDQCDPDVELDIRFFRGADNPPVDYPYSDYSSNPTLWNTYYQKANKGKILWIFPNGGNLSADNPTEPPLYLFIGNSSGNKCHDYSLYCWMDYGKLNTPDDLIKPDSKDAPTTNEQEPNDLHVDAHDLSPFFSGNYGDHTKTDICELKCDYEELDSDCECKADYWDCIIETGEESACAQQKNKCLNASFDVWVECFYGCECAAEMDECFSQCTTTDCLQGCVDMFSACAGYNLDWQNWCMSECYGSNSSCLYKCNPMIQTPEQYINCKKNCDSSLCGCQGSCLDRSA